VESNLLPPTALHGLSYGRGLDHIESEYLSHFTDRLVALGREGAWAALDVLFMYAHGNADRWKSCRESFRRITLVPEMLLVKETERNDPNAFGDVVEKLLNEGDEELAQRIAEEIVNIARQEESQYDLDYVVKPILAILLSKYLQQAWPVLAKGLLEDWRTEFHLSHLLGARFGIGGEPGLISSRDIDYLFEWCDVDPSRHAALLAKMLNVTQRGKEGPPTFTREATELINRYGEYEDVLSALGANIGSYSWVGSLVPYYEEQVTLLSPLLQHRIPRVREWAEKGIFYARREANRQRDRDAEQEIGLY
jgi:hypothetical protein